MKCEQTKIFTELDIEMQNNLLNLIILFLLGQNH